MSGSNAPAVAYSLETTYRALLHRRRRFLLYSLRGENDCIANFDEVAQQVSEWEASVTPADPEDIDDVATSLHHVHIPRLEDAGIVDYDWRTKTLRYRPGPILEAHLDLAADYDFDE